MTTQIRTIYNGRERLQNGDFGPSMTKQSFKNECDLNALVKKYGDPLAVPQTNVNAVYGDFTNGADFMDAVEKIEAVREGFAGLNANIREMFGNDPSQLIDYLGNPANEAEAVRLGIIHKYSDASETSAEVNEGVARARGGNSNAPESPNPVNQEVATS